MKTTVFVKNLRVQAAHGITEAERRTKRTFQVDIKIECNCKATETDAIEDTVNYAEVVEIANAILTSTPRNTVERVATQIANEVMALSSQILKVEVSLAKVPPPLDRDVDATGVILEVTR